MLIEIGQMARLLGITSNGVRFLENEGLVQPLRDETSGYRKFTLEDQATLYMYKLYKLAGMELGDTKDALRCDPFDSIGILRRSIAEQRRQLYERERLVDEIEELLGRGVVVPRFAVERRPCMHCVPYPRKDDKAGPGTRALVSGMSEQYNYLVEHMPSSFFGITYVPDGQGRYSSYRNIVIMDDAYMELTGPAAQDIVEYPALDRCLHATVACTSDEDDTEFLGDAFAWLAENGVRPAEGDIVGRFLHAQREEGRLVYRVELWVPFHEDESGFIGA